MYFVEVIVSNSHQKFPSNGKILTEVLKTKYYANMNELLEYYFLIFLNIYRHVFLLEVLEV